MRKLHFVITIAEMKVLVEHFQASEPQELRLCGAMNNGNLVKSICEEAKLVSKQNVHCNNALDDPLQDCQL